MCCVRSRLGSWIHEGVLEAGFSMPTCSIGCRMVVSTTAALTASSSWVCDVVGARCGGIL